MVGATEGQLADFLTMMEGGGPIEEVAAMTTVMNMQEEVDEMTTAGMTGMIIAEMITGEVVEIVTDAATGIEAAAVIGLEAEVVE